MTGIGACWFVAYGSERIGSSERTLGNLRTSTSQIFFDVRPRGNVRIGFIIFQRPLLDGGVNYAKIIDAVAFSTWAAVWPSWQIYADDDCNREKDENESHTHPSVQIWFKAPHIKPNTEQLISFLPGTL
jgi:hypothetical protein